MHQQSLKEDVFPDAEGWEMEMEPGEAAQWSVGSEFSAGEATQNQAGPEATAESTTGTLADVWIERT